MVSLIEQVEERVRQATHGCIRHLVVKEERGRILVQGQAPTQYAKQLALCGALLSLSRAIASAPRSRSGDRAVAGS